MSKAVGIFISGGGSNMRALAEVLRGDDAAHVAAVVSNNADAGGIAWAKSQGIQTVVVDHKPFGKDRAAFETALSEALTPHRLDMICLAGFMRVLTAGFVDAWQGRFLNIHPSLLPKYKGLHTHQRALDAGDAVHGCTVHEVTPLLDDGPILGQAEVPVLQGDTAETLAARVLVQEHRLYPAVLTRFVRGDRTVVRLR